MKRKKLSNIKEDNRLGSTFNSDKSNVSSKNHKMNIFQMKPTYWPKSFYQERLLVNQLFFKISDNNASLIRTRIRERNKGNDGNAGN